MTNQTTLVLSVVRHAQCPVTVHDVHDRLEEAGHPERKRRKQTLSACLHRLWRAGMINRHARGVYVRKT